MSLLSTKLFKAFLMLCAFILCTLPLCQTAVCGPARLKPALSFGKVYHSTQITSPKPISAGAAPEIPIAQGQDTPSDPYRIGIGDILTISVWQNPDLTQQLAVLPDGDIHFPLAGAVTAQGQTVTELSDTMHKRLEPYVLDPELTVNVDKARSMVVYVIGKVNRPGSFDINEPVDVLQAISMAGGITPFADKDEIRIFRGSLDQTQIFPFDYKQVTKGKLEQNILLSRGDVIVVP
jgi:polysaccharide export outer membrane protein